MRTEELDFHLPPELIAQSPPAERRDARLLHYRRAGKTVEHRRFSDLAALLRGGDLLVLNNAKVVPARFSLRKSTGGRVEGLFIGEPSPGKWDVLLKNLGGACANEVLRLADAPQVQVRVIRQEEGGRYRLAVDTQETALVLLAKIGRMPLPPYIKREKERDGRDDLDRRRYQTVFAQVSGAVAAPTAGLHFDEAIFSALRQADIQCAFVTLHVGLGTFKPVISQSLQGHAMHAESYSIDASAADALNLAKQQGRRIIAVGTTSARVLESQPADQPFAAGESETSIFIYPPYRWKHVDAMVTNFHLPRSTLIALVAAMVGLEEQRRIYQIAIEEKYRFFSYGDAMLIE